MGSAQPKILEDVFEVLEVDPDGKKFDKVSRLRARSDLYELDLLLDVNIDLFPVAAGDKLALALASTLREDGSRMPYDIKSREELYDPKLLSGRSLASDYEYAMHGRVYRYGDAVGGGAGHARADVYVSFGGLLMQLSGDPKRLEALDLDAAVYLLARKV